MIDTTTLTVWLQFELYRPSSKFIGSQESKNMCSQSVKRRYEATKTFASVDYVREM